MAALPLEASPGSLSHLDYESTRTAERLKRKDLAGTAPKTIRSTIDPPPLPKRRTVEVIEGTTRPHIEHAFIKYKDGKGARELETIESSPNHIKLNLFKQERNTDEKYHLIHTHPSETMRPPVPKKLGFFTRFSNWIRGHKPEKMENSYPNLLHSTPDMRIFLAHDKMKYTTIAVRDPKSGAVLGYNVLTKTKESPLSVVSELKKGNKIKAWWKNFKFKRATNKYEKDLWRNWTNGDQNRMRDSYDDFLAKYKLRSRLVPATGFRVNDAKTSFEKIQE